MRVGILGAGQLGRMLALAGYPLGLTFRAFDTVVDAVGGQVMPLTLGSFEDHAALARFADGLDVVTYEFENVPVAAAEFLEQRVAVYPPAGALAVSQDRVVEKTFFQKLGIPTPAFHRVSTRGELEAAVRDLGLPAVLKTTRFGYDGKGQQVVRTEQDVEAAWARLGDVPLIVEGYVAFDRELSLLAVRSRNGDVVCYPLVQNRHEQGILRETLAPAPGLTPELQAMAEDFAGRVLTALDYVGVLAIEFFQRGDRLLANEMAPRVHNSGHWTIEGAATSQFANHLRAICGMPLGATAVRGCVGMVNVLGTVPDMAELLKLPHTYVHLYGKTPQPGRKLGHVTVVVASAGERDLVLGGVRGWV